MVLGALLGAGIGIIGGISVAWVNYAIKVLWPHYNKAITEMVVKSLEPQLRTTVAQIGVLEALDLECLDLGDRPIRIGGIKVYETNEDEVILETPILWGSNAKIRIAAKVRILSVMVYVPVEVTDIVLKAESRITIKPLVETLPCLGAVTVSLLKEPFVDLCVMVVNRLDLMALPMVRDIAHQTVRNIVGDMLVFPNQMSFDIMENGGRATEPEGMLTVKLLKATNLKNSSDMFSKADAFAVIEVREGRPVQSSTKAGSLNPEWNEEFHLIVDDRKLQALTITVKEDDFGWQDKNLGSVCVQLDNMPFMDSPGKTHEVTLNLFKISASTSKSKTKGGAIKQSLPMQPLSQAVKQIRVKKSLQWEPVQIPGVAEAAQPSASAGPSKIDKMSKGEIMVEVTFHPFNREAMAASDKKDSGAAAATGKFESIKTTRRVDQSSLKAARGVLTVTLTRCINLQGDGNTDPQVTISLYDQTAQQPIVQKSAVVFNEASPRWGDKFDFVGISADSFVVFNVKDKATKDKDGSRKSLGKLRIPVPDVVRNRRIKDVWALQETQQGEIALTLEWKSLAFNEVEEEEPHDVLVDEAQPSST